MLLRNLSSATKIIKQTIKITLLKSHYNNYF